MSIDTIERLIRQGRFAEAEAMLSGECMDNAAIQLQRAQCAWGLGRYHLALQAFEQLNRDHPDSLDIAIRLIQAAAGLAQWQLLRATLQSAWSRWPGHPSLVLFVALDQVQRHGPQGVIQFAAPWLERGVQPAELVLAYAQCQTVMEGQSRLPDSIQSVPGARRIESALRWIQSHPRARLHAWPCATLLSALQHAINPGQMLEFGVFRGRSLNLLAAHTDQAIHGFDSFEGLPERWTDKDDQGAYTTQGVLPQVPNHVHLHVGWFDDTLPTFIADNPHPIRFAHIDCDLYSSTKTVLEAITPLIHDGSVLVFDDFFGDSDTAEGEQQAFVEWLKSTGRQSEMLGLTLIGREAAFLLRQ